MRQASLGIYARAAVRAARQAGGLLSRFAGKPARVQTKSAASDLVTEVDRAAELLIYHSLRRACPNLGFLGEEHGLQGRHFRRRWIVDPLDGTMNFVHGLLFFGVSIALVEGNTVLVGVIYDPIRKDLFVATRGGGAFLNGRPIRVSRTPTLSRGLLATGFPPKFRVKAQPYQRWFRALECRTHSVRRMGSTVLCLAYVAAGRMDAFYEQDLRTWDIAAGTLLVREAGGRVSNFHGRLPVLAKGELVASNGRIHRQLLHALRNARG